MKSLIESLTQIDEAKVKNLGYYRYEEDVKEDNKTNWIKLEIPEEKYFDEVEVLQIGDKDIRESGYGKGSDMPPVGFENNKFLSCKQDPRNPRYLWIKLN